jgi:hypothetical protein
MPGAYFFFWASGTGRHQDVGRHVGHQRAAGQRRAHRATELLGENHVEHEVAARATVLLGDSRAEQSGLTGLAPELLVDATRLRIPAVVRVELLVEELARRAAEELVFLGVSVAMCHER